MKLPFIFQSIILFQNGFLTAHMEKANSSHIISVFERSVENIHRKLVNVYIKVALDVSTINRWVSRVNVCPKEK